VKYNPGWRLVSFISGLADCKIAVLQVRVDAPRVHSNDFGPDLVSFHERSPSRLGLVSLKVDVMEPFGRILHFAFENVPLRLSDAIHPPGPISSHLGGCL
jgi:hypothetical protein